MKIRSKQQWMKQLMMVMLAAGLWLAPIQHHASAEPAYAKWGRLAMQTADAKFDADIVDYQYLGRTERADEAVESFRLWLKRSDREFGVLVRITIDKRTNDAKRIHSEVIQ